MAYVPPMVPVPSLQPRKAMPKRGVSVVPTLKSVYSQHSESESEADSEDIGLLSVKRSMHAEVRTSILTPPMPKILSLEERKMEEKKVSDSGYSSSEDEREERALAVRMRMYLDSGSEPSSAEIVLPLEAAIPSHRLSVMSKSSDDVSPQVSSSRRHSYGFQTEYSLSSEDDASPPPRFPPVPSSTSTKPLQLTAGLNPGFSAAIAPSSDDIIPRSAPIIKNEAERQRRSYGLETVYSQGSDELSPAIIPSESRKSIGLETVYSQDSADELTPPPLPTSFVQKQPTQQGQGQSQKPILRLSSPSDYEPIRPLSIMKNRDSKVSIVTPTTGHPSFEFDTDRISITSYRPLPVPPHSAHPATYGRPRSGSNAHALPSPYVTTPLTSIPPFLSRSGSNASTHSTAASLAPSDAVSASVYSHSRMPSVSSSHSRKGSFSSQMGTKAFGTPF
ncbi:hypothetical protein M422DRAFT_262198 [Sphaerobolus stellatus SS14]|uniref:Unplaced genomic scaffold SPHSTscaffold_112, whole genome shotgun sequence n=1 Tax=Sphaerobolus stellatus (strain SS14) TaxID=990650 RepID=A0A0C9VDD3_SPHS4|nr:hypothetical protein M422DRAFT_262198 [Sphaerobolus stellatus SS14]